MKKKYGITKPVLKIIVPGIFLINLLTACNMPLPQAGIDGADYAVVNAFASTGVSILYPVEGTQFQVGDFVDVQSQIGDPSSVAAAILTANSKILRRDQLVFPVTGGKMYQPWIPNAPGIYALQVILETNAGGQHISESVTVIVGGELTPSLTPTLATALATTPPVTANTPTNTPTPDDQAKATGQQNSNCRKGPNIAYDVVGYLMAGETVPIVGRNSDSSWWVVELTDLSKQCWIWGGGVSVSGNTTTVIVIQPPPLPPTATFTSTPTSTPTKQPAKSPYNACHDYPDIATCNSDPNGFGNCYWDTGMDKCQP